mmetsp:Transcript_83989/g.246323  ORF Transcript_83989/g.246323 Transcript_83989/m.246323 type:complete len:213 (+) Transcript_83989:506-1144(+)
MPREAQANQAQVRGYGNNLCIHHPQSKHLQHCSPPLSYTSSRKTVPWFPMVVTHPTAPSDLALHFIRISPELSSFLAHSRTSTTSPSFSFLVVTFSLRVLSFDELPSSSKDSVMIVSLTTLNWFPLSSRKTVPWFPSKVIQPSRSSFKTFAWTLMTSTLSSLIGPSTISTISPTSRRRRVLLSLILMPDVITVSLATFMNTRMRFMNLSLPM